MGCVNTIGYDKFPKQRNMDNLHSIGARVKVYFHYDASKFIMGTVVRDDTEKPNRMIIRLDDGRYVLDVECQYEYADKIFFDREE